MRREGFKVETYFFGQRGPVSLDKREAGPFFIPPPRWGRLGGGENETKCHVVKYLGYSGQVLDG